MDKTNDSQGSGNVFKFGDFSGNLTHIFLMIVVPFALYPAIQAAGSDGYTNYGEYFSLFVDTILSIIPLSEEVAWQRFLQYAIVALVVIVIAPYALIPFLLSEWETTIFGMSDAGLFIALISLASISRLVIGYQFLKGIDVDFDSGYLGFGAQRIGQKGFDFINPAYYVQAYKRFNIPLDSIQSIEYEASAPRYGASGIALMGVSMFISYIGSKNKYEYEGQERREQLAEGTKAIKIITTEGVYSIRFEDKLEIDRLYSTLVNGLGMGAPVSIR